MVILKFFLKTKIINSDFLDNLTVSKAKAKIISKIESKKIGKSNFSLDLSVNDIFIDEDNIFFSDLNGNIYSFSLSSKKPGAIK